MNRIAKGFRERLEVPFPVTLSRRMQAGGRKRSHLASAGSSGLAQKELAQRTAVLRPVGEHGEMAPSADIRGNLRLALEQQDAVSQT